MASIKGKLFEFFVTRILISCGFQPVIPDGLLVYKGSPGLMVQGLGQSHNADVLLSPPVQTPFYFPTRLLVECKCYNKPIGLPIIRNALGLREDVNHFDIVTEKILKNRQNNRKNDKYYKLNRYVYQVAVASIEGFASTAIPFALAHRIPLISFSYSALFADIRKMIDTLDEIGQSDPTFTEYVLSFLKKHIDCPSNNFYYRSEKPSLADDFVNGCMIEFLEEVDRFQKKATIGLLEDGTILFLVEEDEKNTKDVLPSNQKWYDDGYSLYWNYPDTSNWVLRNKNRMYLFELPKEIRDEWMSSTCEQRKEALKIKQHYFSNIILFHGQKSGRLSLEVIQLSEQFLRDTEARLYRN